MTAYVIAEATADSVGGGNPPITASDPVSSNRTLTAKKLATLSWFSREIEQDSIVPILPLYDVAQIYAQAYGLDNAVLNGQSTSTIDTGSDPGATDVRDHFDGLRWNAQQVGSQVDLSAGLTAEKLAAMIRVMGKYADPARCSFITGYAGLAQALILKDVNGNLVYLTRERAGDAATLFTGQVGILMGYPLAVGGVYPQNMNAAGVIDGVTTTKTGVLLCNRDPWLGGNRQGLEVEVSRDERFSSDQIGVRSIQRVAFRALLAASATKQIVVAGVGL
jgi:HK97 family phage major capsid protein